MFEIIAEHHFIGLGPVEAAAAVLAAMRLSDAESAWAAALDFEARPPI